MFKNNIILITIILKNNLDAFKEIPDHLILIPCGAKVCRE